MRTRTTARTPYASASAAAGVFAFLFFLYNKDRNQCDDARNYEQNRNRSYIIYYPIKHTLLFSSCPSATDGQGLLILVYFYLFIKSRRFFIRTNEKINHSAKTPTNGLTPEKRLPVNNLPSQFIMKATT